MEVDGELYHLVSWDGLALVLRVRHTLVGQVERAVYLFRCHRRIRGIDDDIIAAYTLQESLRMHLVGLLLDVAEVLCLCLLVAQAFFVRVKYDILGLMYATGNLFLMADECHLRQVADDAERLAVVECVGDGYCRLLAHAVADEVCRSIEQQTGAQAVFPVVVMGESAQGSLDAAEHDGHVGEQLAQYLGIDNACVLRAAVMATVGREGIFRTQSLGSGVFVDHRVHTPRGDGEEEARLTELLEVAEVAVPVRLWHNGHLISGSLKGTTYDGGTKGRVVHIGVAGKEYHIERVPTT